jgi:hypothetical protein
VLATRHWFQPFFLHWRTFAKKRKLKIRKEVILEVFSRQKRGGKNKRKNRHIHIFGSYCVAKDIEG